MAKYTINRAFHGAKEGKLFKTGEVAEFTEKRAGEIMAVLGTKTLTLIAEAPAKAKAKPEAVETQCEGSKPAPKSKAKAAKS